MALRAALGGLFAIGRARLVSRAAGASAEHALGGRKVAVGSDPANDLVIEHSTVSRRHAILTRRAGSYYLTDLGSTNGTYLNGRRLGAPARLRSGDELRFGALRFTFARGAAPPPSARGGAPRPRFGHAAALLAVAVLFAGAFALTAYLTDFDLLQKLAEPTAGRPTPGEAVASPATAPTATAPQARPTTPALAAGPEAASTTPASAAGPSAPWLSRVNHYRTVAGLNPVSEDRDLSAGERSHARYLIENYGGRLAHGANLGALMHTEEPGKPGYSPAGLAAARSSDVSDSPGPPPDSPTWAIDTWMSGAFHRLNILNPGLRRVAYGDECADDVCVAALNVTTDVVPLGPKPRPLARPVEFPPMGAAFPQGSLYGEWPDPAASCPGYRDPTGVALTLQLGTMTPAKLENFVLRREGGGQLEACGFDASSYANPDPDAQKLAREILREQGAAVVIPRAPLRGGRRYDVSMTVNGRTYAWLFSIVP